MSIKMIALDLDGTTLRTDKSLSKRTAETLRTAIRQGIYVVIATGRTFSALPKEIFEVEGIKYIVNSNGATIRKMPDAEVVYKDCISGDAVFEIADMLETLGHGVEVFAGGKAYIGEDKYEEIANNREKYPYADYTLSTRIPVDNIYEHLRELKDQIENISVKIFDMDEKSKMFKKLKSVENVTLTSSYWFNIEIGGANTSKANALSFLMKELGISKNELMACGDSLNDQRMLELAGISVLMENGNEELKKFVDYITASNDDDGVAKAIEKFALK